MISEEILKAIPLLLLQSASLCRKDHVVHERLPQVLKGSSDVILREFGELLDNLRTDRITADYKLNMAISKAKAADVYVNATDLRDEIHKYGVAKLAVTLKRDLEKVHSNQPPSLGRGSAT